MKQFPEKNSQTQSNENVQSPQVEMPPHVLPATDTDYESIEVSADYLASNINRLIEEGCQSPIAPNAEQQEFDAVDFARLASKPPTRIGGSSPDQIDDYLEETYGAADPYVDPAELNRSEIQNTDSHNNQTAKDELILSSLPPFTMDPQLDSINETMEELDDFQRQLELLESEAADRQLPQSTPTVEIIGINPTETEPLHSDSKQNVNSLTGLTGDEFPPVTWFAETEAAEQVPETENQAAPIALPIVIPETGESIFDVRDFSDSVAGTIEPIPGSFDVDPDLFEIKTNDELESSGDSRQTHANSPQHDNNSELHNSPIVDNQVFVAGTGDIIQINGSDGFDHIDLACFDVKWAMFSEQVIQIDNQQGTSFEIQYQDISYALFADGIEVRLDSNPIND